MSIKSQTPGIASDIPLMKKQRKPIYKVRHKGLSPNYHNISHVDNVSHYVKKNLEQIPKPRSKEYR